MPYNEQLLKHVDAYGYPLPPGRRWKLRRRAIDTGKNAVAGMIAALLSVIGVLLRLGRLGRRYPPLTPRSFHPRRILVIRLDPIGDLVLSLTVVHTLKRAYPEATIDLLATPTSAKVITIDPHLAGVILYDPNLWRRPGALIKSKNWRDLRRLLAALHARHYDLAISLYGSWAATLAVLSGAKRRVGYGAESFPGFMTDSVPGRHWEAGDHLHEVDYCLKLAQAAGATVTPADRVPHLTVDPRAQAEVAQMLAEEGIQSGKLLIACHVCSSNGQSKRWPIPYWTALLDRLIREQGAQIVLTGAPNDLPLIERVTNHMQEHAVNLAQKTSLAQLAALLQRANLLITGDSGPMHIASAVGTPLIAVHGPTDPAQSGPVSLNATILHSDIWCSPCYNARTPADCRFFTTQCMKNIRPQQVYEAVLSKLQLSDTAAAAKKLASTNEIVNITSTNQDNYA